MPYNTVLAQRIREYLSDFSELNIEEKEMFSGLTFMVNGKMCVSVSGENLMCRFDPDLQQELFGRKGFTTMIMKGRELKGYCYVEPAGFASKHDFDLWLKLCLDYNKRAKSSKKKNS